MTGHLVQELVHDIISLCELWHQRFAHLHYKVLPYLKKIVTGMSDLQFEHDGVYRDCALSKNAKNSFPSSDKISKGILNFVHLDICGPMSIPSSCGHLYYVIFIDDFSWKTWIYFLKSKNDTFNKF